MTIEHLVHSKQKQRERQTSQLRCAIRKTGSATETRGASQIRHSFTGAWQAKTRLLSHVSEARVILWRVIR